jgi:SSS family transporter
MGFSALDYIIVALYLAGMAVLGILAGGRQTSARDYFLSARRIPWWAVCFAIVATETSTLTFISIPGLAYAANLNFLQVTLGYLLGRIAVSALLLPAYARGDLLTAYQLLDHRFGPAMRSTASVTFLGTRVLADGVRLYATAIPVALLMQGWNLFAGVSPARVYVVAILVLAGVTLVYTSFGGVRAVIWTDVVQMFIYLGGAAGAAIILLSALPPGAFAAIPAEKFDVLRVLPGDGGLLGDRYTLAASLIGGAFLSMASHGTDQIIVQRLLTVGELSGSRKALIGSGIVVILQFALFLVIGLLLYAYYGGSAPSTLGLSRADELFPKFILERMPTGMSGLIIAGLLAAAMSTLSGSINSLAAATLHDLYLPFAGPRTEAQTLSLARRFSAGWCVVLVVVALAFIANTSTALVELALSIASVTYGGVLGTFLLGVLTRRVGQGAAIAGFLAGVASSAALFFTGAVAWTWLTAIGTIVCLLTGLAASPFLPGPPPADPHT